jgi:hypothetical protein
VLIAEGYAIQVIPGSRVAPEDTVAQPEGQSLQDAVIFAPAAVARRQLGAGIEPIRA